MQAVICFESRTSLYNLQLLKLYLCIKNQFSLTVKTVTWLSVHEKNWNSLSTFKKIIVYNDNNCLLWTTKFFIKAKINVQYYIDGKICCRKNVIGVSHSKKNSYKKRDSLVAPKKYRQHFLNSNSMNISVCETSS